MEALDKIRPVWSEINLNNLVHNLNEIKRVTSNKSEIMAIVKADAYGHGAIEIGETLVKEGIKTLAVATMSEAIELRKAGIDSKILILGYTPRDQFKYLLKFDIIPTIYDYDAAFKLSEVAIDMNETCKIHIKIDTGMNRLGFKSKDESVEEILKISKLKGIYLEGIFSHFACADEHDKSFARTQYKEFKLLIDKLERLNLNIDIKHISNSAAIIDLPKYHLNLVRAGISLYGLYPSREVSADTIDLKPVMTLKTQISNIKKVPKGTGISYGQMFTTNKSSLIATIPIGYADGFSRLLDGNSLVTIDEKKVDVVGKICMDQCMLDVTDTPNLHIDKEVIIFGEGKNVNSAEDIARNLGTISYEVVCMISRRVPRVYMKNNHIIKVVDYITKF